MRVLIEFPSEINGYIYHRMVMDDSMEKVQSYITNMREHNVTVKCYPLLPEVFCE